MKLQFLIPIDYSSWLPSDNEVASSALKEAINSLSQEANISLKKKVFADKTVYTLAVNTLGKHRLIFERVTLLPSEVPAYVLRGIALYHDYRKALTWTPLVRIDESTLSDSYIKTDGRAAIEESPCTEVYYERQWLEPTVIQLEALLTIELPHLVVGPPGSGKTVFSLAYFQRLALSHQESGSGVLKLLYITAHPELNNVLKRSWSEWASFSLSRHAPPIHLQFMTFAELSGWRESKPSCELFDETSLLQLIERHKKTIRCTLSAKEILAGCLSSSYLLNLDMQAGKTFQDSRYCSAGVNQVGIEAAHKEAVYNLYAQVHKALGEQVYPGLSVVPVCSADFQYHYTCVDEAQSVTMQDLLNAWSVTCNGNVLYCGDSYQRGSSKLSSIAQLQPSIYSLYQMNLNKTMLLETHRLKPSVASLCNQLVLLSNHLNKGITDKTSYPEFSAVSSAEKSKHALFWMDDYQEDLQQLSHEATAAAMVIHPDDAVTAKHYIKGSNVFCVNEARGQQFSKVLLYLSSKTLQGFSTVNQAMQDENIDENKDLAVLLHASPQKSRALNGAYFEIISDVMVALSRSYGEVWILCETENLQQRHQLKRILSWLKRQCVALDRIETIAISSQEEWLLVIHDFINRGALKQAGENIQLHFNVTESVSQEYLTHYQKAGAGLTAAEGMAWFVSMQSRLVLPPVPVVQPNVILPVTCDNDLLPVPATQAHSMNGAGDSIPSCIKKIEEEDVLGDITLSVGELLKLDSLKAGKWLCGYPIKGKTLFERIFLDNVSVVRLSIFLADNVNKALFYKAIAPHLHKMKISDGKTTCFQHMVLALVFGQKIPKSYSPIIYLGLESANSVELNAIIASPRAPKNATLLFLLLCREGGAQFFSEALIKKVSHDALNCPVGDGPHEGKNLLYVLYANTAYSSAWGGLEQRITQAGMTCTVSSAVDKHSNSTPLYALLLSPYGRLFFREKWDFFKSKITTKSLHQAVTGEGAHKGATPFVLLCCTPEGKCIIKDHLNFFKGKVTKECLHQTITGDGPDKGKTPLYYLFGSPEGQRLLEAHWDFFQDKITEDSLHQVVTGEGSNQGLMPFFFLCAGLVGRRILEAHWDFFQDKITRDVLHQVVTGEGPNQGLIPFFFLCDSPEGRRLLEAHWDFFQDKITKDSLHQVVTGEGAEKGKTPFCALCGNPEGRRLLEAHWDFFQDKITKDSLHQVVTGEGPDKGKTPFSFLSESPVLLELIKPITHPPAKTKSGQEFFSSAPANSLPPTEAAPSASTGVLSQ